MNIEKKAFSLVELIVAVTIISILGSIGTYSYLGYLSGTRDSKRITELDNVKTALETYQIREGLFPDPDTAVSITYSGATVWQQGIFGEEISELIGYSKNKVLDPKTASYYTYSVKNTGKEYSLAGVLEKKENKIAITNNSFAEGTETATAIVMGNYNGAITLVNTGGLDYILALPSIVASDLSSTDLVNIIDNNRLVYNGYENLPASFENTEFKVNAGLDFSANELILFEGTISEFYGERERVLLLYAIKDSYLDINSQLDDEYIISVINNEINTLSPSRDTANLACDLINYKLNYKVDCDYTNFRAFYVLKDNSVLNNIDFNILIGKQINYIFQDSKDILRFATDSGVFTYNLITSSWGNNIYTVEDGLISNNVKVINEDSNGDIWFGTNNGLSQYNIITDIFTDFVKNGVNASGLPHNDIYDITLDPISKLLYIGTHSGIGIYNPVTGLIDDSIILSTDNPSTQTNTIFIDSFGVKWYGTERGIVRDNGSNLPRYDGRDGLPFQNNSGNNNLKQKTYVNTIGEYIATGSTYNELWIGTEDGIGVMTTTYPGSIRKYYTGNSNLSNNIIHSIYQDPVTKKMWFGTADGVSIYDRDNNTFENYYVDKDGVNLGAVFFIYSSGGLTILGTSNGSTTLK